MSVWLALMPAMPHADGSWTLLLVALYEFDMEWRLCVITDAPWSLQSLLLGTVTATRLQCTRHLPVNTMNKYNVVLAGCWLLCWQVTPHCVPSYSWCSVQCALSTPAAARNNQTHAARTAPGSVSIYKTLNDVAFRSHSMLWHVQNSCCTLHPTHSEATYALCIAGSLLYDLKAYCVSHTASPAVPGSQAQQPAPGLLATQTPHAPQQQLAGPAPTSPTPQRCAGSKCEV